MDQVADWKRLGIAGRGEHQELRVVTCSERIGQEKSQKRRQAPRVPAILSANMGLQVNCRPCVFNLQNALRFAIDGNGIARDRISHYAYAFERFIRIQGDRRNHDE